jgi:hypothetical protein
MTTRRNSMKRSLTVGATMAVAAAFAAPVNVEPS